MKTFSDKIMANEIFRNVELQVLFIIWNLEDIPWLLFTFTDQFLESTLRWNKLLEEKEFN